MYELVFRILHHTMRHKNENIENTSYQILQKKIYSDFPNAPGYWGIVHVYLCDSGPKNEEREKFARQKSIESAKERTCAHLTISIVTPGLPSCLACCTFGFVFGMGFVPCKPIKKLTFQTYVTIVVFTFNRSINLCIHISYYRSLTPLIYDKLTRQALSPYKMQAYYRYQ